MDTYKKFSLQESEFSSKLRIALGSGLIQPIRCPLFGREALFSWVFSDTMNSFRHQGAMELLLESPFDSSLKKSSFFYQGLTD